MKIPNSLKIGGNIYTVEITDKLDTGKLNSDAEISYRDLIIRVCPAAKSKMESNFVHEMVHGILDYLGYIDHDEKKVDEFSNALYAVFVDNPEMFMSEELNE